MPNLSGYPIIDVALGLSFLFFLLSIVASALFELFAAALAWRAKNLERAVRGLLGEGLAKDVYANWRIRALFQKPDDASSRPPSYIPPRAFALALFDTLVPGVAPADGPNEDVIAKAQGAVAKIDNERVRKQLQAILQTGSTNIDAGRRAAEQLFNDRMERASGWYKRKAQFVLWGIALFVAFALNVNSFHVGSQLWKDDALRAAVVTQAQAALERPAAVERGSCPAGQVRDTSTDPDGCKPDPEALTAVADSVDAVTQLNLPIGWAKENQPAGWLGWLGWVFGCLITAAAVSLGSPFWFSVLQKVSDLRGAGKRPAADEDDVPAATRAPALAEAGDEPPDRGDGGESATGAGTSGPGETAGGSPR